MSLFGKKWKNVPDDEGGRESNETGKAGKIPGEQQGEELDSEAEMRPRNMDGEFAEESSPKPDLFFKPNKFLKEDF